MTNKENIIAATGGFRLESVQRFKTRQAEIRLIEQRFKSGKYSEQSHRRLCELKGIVFDSYDLDPTPEHLGKNVSIGNAERLGPNLGPTKQLFLGQNGE